MSTYRNIERARHIDERVTAVGPIARALWDYLCCNQQDHASGLYRLSVPATSEDTGWSVDEVESSLDELVRVGLIERDKSRRLVWVKNMLRKSYKNPTDKQMTNVTSHLEAMPETPLVERFVAYYLERYQTRIPIGPHSNGSYSVSVSDSDSASVSENKTPPEIRQVLDLMRDAMQQLTPGARGPQDTPQNRTLIRKPMRVCGATLDDWATVISRQLVSVRGDREAWKFLSLSTLGRPKNFARLLEWEHLDAPQTHEVRQEFTGL